MGILGYTEAHQLFRDRLRVFINNEILPYDPQWEKDKIVPKESWKKMGQAGFLCTEVAKEYGGHGLDFLYSVIVCEEMAAAGHTGGIMAGHHSDIVVPYIESFAKEEHKKKYLPGCVSGDIITALAMTEPGAGSDLSSMETTATTDGNDIVLNGSKTFISNGINCGLVVLAVRNTEIEGNHGGISLYLVEGDTPGFTKRPVEKMGLHSQDTAEFFFSDCRIPKENLMGKKGTGFSMLMQKLQQERLICAINNVAAAESLLKQVIKFCKSNYENGKALSKYQAIRFHLAELASDVKLNRALLDQVILRHMNKENVVTETMMVKYTSSEMSNRLADRILDLTGEFGLQESNGLAQQFRDLRVTTIFAGTTEVMKTVISQYMGL